MGTLRSLLQAALALSLSITLLGLAPAPNSSGPLAAPEPGVAQASVLAQGTGQTALPGHVPGLLAQSTPLAGLAADGSQSIAFSVVLRRTDEAGFVAYLQAANDPRSPSFRRFIRQPQELARRFGPSQDAYDAVRSFLLRESGFTLVRDAPDRLMITVQGTRSQINRALGAQGNCI